jgi:hypothetical protein
MCDRSPERDTLRNEVDLISNALSLNWETDHPIGSILSEARLPPDALPILLHELTHWQCFQTTVGGAFRGLWDILIKGSWKQETAAAIKNGEVPEDYLRVLANMSAGLLIYLPWIEGLALFAEWDALPGRSDVLSKPMHFTSILNPDLSFPRTVNEVFENLGGILRRVRKGTDAERRKINLLAVPLLGPKGHYLAGYLGVKALHQKAVSTSALFRDTDFFLAFAMARIFHDPCAAAILFDTETPPPEWSDRLLMRLIERIGIFNARDLDRFARLYERAEQSSPQREQAVAKSDLRNAKLKDKLPENLMEQLSEVAPGHDLLNESLELSSEDWDLMHSMQVAALVRNVPQGTAPLNRTVYSHSLSLRHRNMIRIRRVVGSPRIEDGHLLFEDKNRKQLARCKQCAASSIPKGKAVYLLYFDEAARCLMRLVLKLKGRKAILLGFEAFPRTAQPLEPDQIRFLVEAVIGGENHEQKRTRPGGADEVMKMLDAAIDPANRRGFVKTASEHALVPVMARLPEEMHTPLVDGLSNFGVFGLMGKQRPIVDAAAKISLLASEQLPLAKIREAMTGDDQTADEFLQLLDDCGMGRGRFYDSSMSGDADPLILGF